MAFASRDRTASTLSEINVTPLVDVMLVLLIIFMITAPMLSASVDVELAQSSIMPAPANREHIVVSITAEQRIYVADKFTEVPNVATTVQRIMKETGINTVALRGDKKVPYGFILQVLDRLHAASITTVGLVMAPPTPTPPESTR